MAKDHVLFSFFDQKLMAFSLEKDCDYDSV